ncbi:hypothetical protein J1614_010332 [Plenodomus biglobosus]|nr:hypothetical protein J1614_010332 [Plenodomus biglobosus]
MAVSSSESVAEKPVNPGNEYSWSVGAATMDLICCMAVMWMFSLNLTMYFPGMEFFSPCLFKGIAKAAVNRVSTTVVASILRDDGSYFAV